MVDTIVQRSLYDHLPNLVLGFHGCSRDTFEKVIYGREHLKKSENEYDWLGNGIYFWENGYERAMDWARARFGEDGLVVGAVLSYGHCLNLTDIGSTRVLKLGYSLLKRASEEINLDLPQNKNGRSDTEKLLRNLDCAVIQLIHRNMSMSPSEVYDSVRGVFQEGKVAYPGSDIAEKTHIQICVVNPNCIKGYFSPIEPLEGFRIP